MSAHMICRWVAPDDVADFERRGWVRSQARGHHEHYAIFMSTQEKVEMTTAATICTRATKLVDGERSRTHGAKEHNFRAIADIWSAYLANRLFPDGPLGPSDIDIDIVLSDFETEDLAGELRRRGVNVPDCSTIDAEWRAAWGRSCHMTNAWRPFDGSEPNDEIIVHYPDGEIDIWWAGHKALPRSEGSPTHWMPLPESPEGTAS